MFFNDFDETNTDLSKTDLAIKNLQECLVSKPNFRKTLEQQLGRQQYYALLIALEHSDSIVWNTAYLMPNEGIFFITDEYKNPQLILNIPYSYSVKAIEKGIEDPKVNVDETLKFIQKYDIKPVTISLSVIANTHIADVVIHRAEDGKFVISSADSLNVQQKFAGTRIFEETSELINKIFHIDIKDIIIIQQDKIKKQGQNCCGFHAGLNSGFLLDFTAIHSALEDNTSKNYNYSKCYGGWQYENTKKLRDVLFIGDGHDICTHSDEPINLSYFIEEALQLAKKPYKYYKIPTNSNITIPSNNILSNIPQQSTIKTDFVVNNNDVYNNTKAPKDTIYSTDKEDTFSLPQPYVYDNEYNEYNEYEDYDLDDCSSINDDDPNNHIANNQEVAITISNDYSKHDSSKLLTELEEEDKSGSPKSPQGQAQHTPKTAECNDETINQYLTQVVNNIISNLDIETQKLQSPTRT